MSSRSSDDRRSRAEARRRARLAARGELAQEDEQEARPEEPEREERGGFLRRLFPPAPPLPGRPDPLAGFEASGPLRPVSERVFLLRSNLVSWLVPGVVAFVGLFASFFYAQGLLGLLGTFVLFGSLIAAGWFGWQRPTLFGTAAALLSFFLTTALILFSFAQLGAAGPDALGEPSQVIANLVVQAAYQAGLGFLGGWYGGYLRRRQAQVSSEVRRRR